MSVKTCRSINSSQLFILCSQFLVRFQKVCELGGQILHHLPRLLLHSGVGDCRIWRNGPLKRLEIVVVVVVVVAKVCDKITYLVYSKLSYLLLYNGLHLQVQVVLEQQQCFLELLTRQ